MYTFDLSLIFLILGYVALLYVARLEKYSHMLTANIFSCWLVAIYLVINGAYAGAAVSSIAGFASMAQIFLSKDSASGTSKMKNTVAVIFAVIAVTILYQKPNDLLPCIGFTQNRILEAQGSAQCIRLAILGGALLWAFYALGQSLYLMALLEITVSIYALSLLIKHSKKPKSSNEMRLIAKHNTT